MRRRDFLRSSGALCAGLVFSKSIPAWADVSTPSWRTFDVTTRVELLKPSGETHIWLPAALIRETPFQKTLSNKFSAESGSAKLSESKEDSLGIVTGTYPNGVSPVLTLTSRVSLRNYAVDLLTHEHAHLSKAEREYYLQSTKYIPTDGIVKEKANEATKGATTDVDKARGIYEWIVENTFRDPKVRGCGRGDIRFMVESGNLGGKCADLNALYVGMARASGVPARDVYGLRVAKSELGYKSLGLSTDKATKAQHCRAEVYLENHGWVPVDPADVRKVALEEPPGSLKLADEKVSAARTRLFGSWEMNWMAYNFAHDVALPGSKESPLVFFMYPQAETAGGRLDPLDPDNFKYEITVKEIV
jgi:transglutaminase-like putative cysteine protease